MEALSQWLSAFFIMLFCIPFVRINNGNLHFQHFCSHSNSFLADRVTKFTINTCSLNRQRFWQCNGYLATHHTIQISESSGGRSTCTIFLLAKNVRQFLLKKTNRWLSRKWFISRLNLCDLRLSYIFFYYLNISVLQGFLPLRKAIYFHM